MALHDRPQYFHKEPEPLKPRNGIRMAVQFCALSGEPLAPTDDTMSHGLILARLAVGSKNNVHDRHFLPDTTTQPLAEATMTVYSFIMSGNRGGTDPKYEIDMDNYLAEIVKQTPLDERTVHFETASVPGEALYPEDIGKENLFQFILTREGPSQLQT